ncbi:hypothetical protein OUZ56_028196 [Daphnia magna]|uniref:Peptidase M14 domain-containing protein n=1 Tax=Daphnia magna TaxID=35525 RepID=A0ABR0B3A3_9CRUS|nr:hypothetical protein OUZ56_028196 [Daphnia magna]
MKLLILLSVFAASAIALQKRYDGYQLFQVTPRDRASYDALVELYERSEDYDFWIAPRAIDIAMDIMVPPARVATFVDLMHAFRMEYRVKMIDVQTVLDMAREERAQIPRVATPRYSVDWNTYYDFNAISAFVNEIAAAHPNLVTVSSIGRTHEGRDMPLVKISSGGAGKKAIVVDGGIHAREWISPAFVTWLINELVENYAAHPQYVDNVDWYIMPVINPDGYQYTFAPLGDRLWRKNRRPNNNGIGGSSCMGTDMNRNFGFHWNEGGSSSNGCSDTFHGGAAFSEVESQHVRDAILAVAGPAEMYLTFHAYGQYWLTPWGYTSALPSDYTQLYNLAVSAVNELTAVYGTQYTIGTSTNVLYVASGGSDDWAKGGAGIPFSYTVEMRDEGLYGFELPARQILPNNLEVWEAIKVMAESLF